MMQKPRAGPLLRLASYTVLPLNPLFCSVDEQVSINLTLPSESYTPSLKMAVLPLYKVPKARVINDLSPKLSLLACLRYFKKFGPQMQSGDAGYKHLKLDWFERNIKSPAALSQEELTPRDELHN